MRRLARWMSTLCSAASLLLCVAVCVLWVRSYRVGDRVARVGQRTHIVLAASGLLAFNWTDEDTGKPPGWLHETFNPRNTPWPPLGFRYGNVGRRDGKVIRQVVVPHYALTLLTAVLPAAWLARRFRSRRMPGLCPSCGYDLRASTDRCPECGATRSLQVIA